MSKHNLFGQPPTLRQWEIDSRNGGLPTAWELGWNGTEYENWDNPTGRFEGKANPYATTPEGGQGNGGDDE